jgi:hypothetical protein
LVPDSKALALERENTLGLCAYKEMLGGKSLKLSKVDKTFCHSHNVFSPHAFAAWMANCVAYQASIYLNAWEGHLQAPYALSNTFLFRTFHQLADLVKCGKAHQFFKMYMGSPAHILLWLTSMVDQVTILVMARVSDPININHVLKGQYASIKIAKYYEAVSLVYDTWDKFNKIILGMDSAPTCLGH